MNAVVENYRYLSLITSQMREAATLGEWDHLVELEQQCSLHVENMKQLDQQPLDEETRKLKVELIHRILADDAAIREQTMPWMAKLQRMIQSSRSEQRLMQTYGRTA